MAERTKGGGFRERIYFDEQLWAEIEHVASHMKLEPKELVKTLTALGLAQIKSLSMMHTAAQQDAQKEVLKKQMVEDFERNTGMSGDTPVMGDAPTRTAPARTAPAQSTAMSAPGRNPVQKTELARSEDRPLSYLRGL
jgi:hypothetical protein